MNFLFIVSYFVLFITLIYFFYILIGIIRYDLKYKDRDINIKIKKDDFYIIVPVYNEDIEILKSHINFHRKYNIIYVLNGSSEKYKEILEKNNVKYLYIEEKNKKKAIWKGLNYIKNFNPKYVILLDSDTFLIEKNIKIGVYYLEKYNFSAVSFNIFLYGNSIWNDVFKLNKGIYIYTLKGFSGNGNQLSLNGECIMGKFNDIYEAYNELVEKHSNKRIGDDQILSSILINNGKKIFYIDHYYVMTKGINNFEELIKKNIRYTRAFVYSILVNIKEKYILSRDIFYFLYILSYLVPIFIYIYILYNSLSLILFIKYYNIYNFLYYFIVRKSLADFIFLHHLITRYYTTIPFHTILHLFNIIIKYLVLSFYIFIIYAEYKKFSNNKNSIFYYFILSFLFPIIVFYSLFTFFKDEWLTR
ncbi:hypothetical protein YN1_0500 [Nanoarchaeota archaeon]